MWVRGCCSECRLPDTHEGDLCSPASELVPSMVVPTVPQHHHVHFSPDPWHQVSAHGCWGGESFCAKVSKIRPAPQQLNAPSIGPFTRFFNIHVLRAGHVPGAGDHREHSGQRLGTVLTETTSKVSHDPRVGCLHGPIPAQGRRAPKGPDRRVHFPSSLCTGLQVA